MPEQIDIKYRIDNMKNPEQDSVISDEEFDFDYDENTDEAAEVVICTLK